MLHGLKHCDASLLPFHQDCTKFTFSTDAITGTVDVQVDFHVSILLHELRGLSFAAIPKSDDPAPDLAFEWRLWLDEDSRGWLVTNPEGYTLSGVRLDIVPVQVQRPLYRPHTLP